MYVKNSLNPVERKTLATCTIELIKVDINPKNRTHIKLVLVYRNTRITAADDAFNAPLEEILLMQHECVIMGDLNLPTLTGHYGDRHRRLEANYYNLLQSTAFHNMCWNPLCRTIYLT